MKILRTDSGEEFIYKFFLDYCKRMTFKGNLQFDILSGMELQGGRIEPLKKWQETGKDFLINFR